jgi:hypothetical protein
MYLQPTAHLAVENLQQLLVSILTLGINVRSWRDGVVAA